MSYLTQSPFAQQRAQLSADHHAEQQAAQRALERRRWTAIAIALTTMTAVVGGTTWLVLGTQWLGMALGTCVAAIALAAWYALAGRTIGMNADVRERVLERHYVGVAWYASMLHTARERGGYERGLRRELTRLAAARLAERHGVNLYRDPATAAALIGADRWPLVDPALLNQQPGTRPADVPIRAVGELIERLERM
ncbi:MAG: hypothetical protein JF587_13530 [Catenulisporales bacterium]|jgi:hypothetical protein|nr:hypothetical protein [Catenulisporales bacterium]